MGRLPIPLSEKGAGQVRELAESLKSWPIDKMVASPLLRATETAQILNKYLDLPFDHQEGISEIDVGKWEGRYWEEMSSDPILKAFERTPSKTRPPGGETLKEVQNRAVKTVEENLNHGNHSGVLFVSHADTIRAIISHYIQLDLDRSRQLQINNASVSVIHINEDRPRLILSNFLADPVRFHSTG